MGADDLRDEFVLLGAGQLIEAFKQLLGCGVIFLLVHYKYK